MHRFIPLSVLDGVNGVLSVERREREPAGGRTSSDASLRGTSDADAQR